MTPKFSDLLAQPIIDPRDFTQDFTRTHRHEPIWRPSEAELWTLHCYLVRFYGIDEYDKCTFTVIFPEQSTDLRNVRIKQISEDQFITVVQAYDEEQDEITDIDCTIVFWDKRYRLRWLNSRGVPEVDPADVLSDGDEKWVRQIETKYGMDEVQVERTRRTTYTGAGGKDLDPKHIEQRYLYPAFGPVLPAHSTMDLRYHWHPSRTELTTNSNYNVIHGPTMERHRVDRAHADEMV